MFSSYSTMLTTYIDPGAGSMLFQLIIAFFVGIGFFCKESIKKAFRFIVSKFKQRKK